MKMYKAVTLILLALSFAKCGDNNNEKANYFSFDDSVLKPKYQSTDKVDIKLLNAKNKTIDSIVYFINDIKTTTTKGNAAFSFEMKGK